MNLYIESGKKKVFAAALDWPGWCRAGRDESGALEALLTYGERYARILAGTPLAFQPPQETGSFKIIEHLPGTSGTDFGAPAAIPQADRRPMNAADFARARQILTACWAAFDHTAVGAQGRELRKGPRGGGRTLEKIIDHLLEADQNYLRRQAWKHKRQPQDGPQTELEAMRQSILDAFQNAQDGSLPEKGPRGGLIWPPRYFIRRTAWHLLDHLWEIEDRLL